MDLDFFDIVDAQDNIFDDRIVGASERFDDELQNIDEIKENIKNKGAPKVPIGISNPERNLLDPAVQGKIKEELKIHDMKYVTAPKIFIITASGDISGIKFNEYEHMDLLKPSEDIPIIKSNCGELVHPSYHVMTEVKKSKRGRTKKVQKKKSVENLKSQITFCVRRPEVYRSNQLIKHKLFRSGNIQISGLTYDDIDQAKVMVDTLIQSISGTKLVSSEEKVYMNSLCAIMENYKFNIILKKKESINLLQFKREIDINAHLLDVVNDSGDVIRLLYVTYDCSKAAMKMVLVCPNMPKKKETLITNVFSTSKVNILGCCGIKYARVIGRFLNAILTKSHNKIIIYNKDCNWRNYRMIDKMLDSSFDDEYEPGSISEISEDEFQEDQKDQ